MINSRETSELSSSGSEKSFRKGFNKDRGDNFRNKTKPNFNKKFEKPLNDAFGSNSGGGDTWNTAPATTTEVPNAAPSTAKFVNLSIDNTESIVLISWFHNPTNFYCQIENTQVCFLSINCVSITIFLLSGGIQKNDGRNSTSLQKPSVKWG